jgi:hypothetical protein
MKKIIDTLFVILKIILLPFFILRFIFWIIKDWYFENLCKLEFHEWYYVCTAGNPTGHLMRCFRCGSEHEDFEIPKNYLAKKLEEIT